MKPAARSKNPPLGFPSTRRIGNRRFTVTTRSLMSSSGRSSSASSTAFTTVGPDSLKRCRISMVSSCPGANCPIAAGSRTCSPTVTSRGSGVTASVPVFSTVIRIVASRSVPTTSLESSMPDIATFRRASGGGKLRTMSLGGLGSPFTASPKLVHAEGLSKRQPSRWLSVKTTISLAR